MTEDGFLVGFFAGVGVLSLILHIAMSVVNTDCSSHCQPVQGKWTSVGCACRTADGWELKP